MKNNLKNIIIEALKKSFEIEATEGLVEIQKAAKNVGSDYCTNIAMKLAKQLKMNPMEVADKILLQIEKSDMYECSAAKPGYVLAKILHAMGKLRIPRDVEIAGLDYNIMKNAKDDEKAVSSATR